jgi:hypothetical protein
VSLRSLNTSMSASPWFRVTASVVFGYEAVALHASLPTISMLCWRKPIISVPVLGTLALHLFLRPTDL